MVASQDPSKEIPWHSYQRISSGASAEARAKAEGRSVDEILAEMKGEPAPQAQSQESTVESPESASVPTGGGRDLDAEAQKYRVPRPILERSMFARAKADGTAVPEMAGVGAPVAAVAVAPLGGWRAYCSGGTVGPPPGVRTQRLLTVVKAGGDPRRNQRASGQGKCVATSLGD